MSRRSEKQPEYRRKFLAVFNFEDTIIYDDLEWVLLGLVYVTDIDGNCPNPADFIRKRCWLENMQGVFEMLRKHNIFEDEILHTIRTQLPAIRGMIKLIKMLHDELNFDIIIISDANTILINTWLASNGLTKCVKRVITHKAEFDADRCLKITPYETQSTCQLSSANLCKGQVLDDYIAECRANEALVYRSVYFVGNSTHDLCPVMRLSDHDFACPRDYFKLDLEIEKKEANEKKAIDPTVLRWSNAEDLTEAILETIPRTDEEFPFLLTEERERKYAFVL